MNPYGLFAFIAVGMVEIILAARMRRHRIDLRPHEGITAGKSAIWQVNVFNPGNYHARGRRLLRWLVGLLALSLLVLVWLVAQGGRSTHRGPNLPHMFPRTGPGAGQCRRLTDINPEIPPCTVLLAAPAWLL
jgi:hypothetical protein